MFNKIHKVLFATFLISFMNFNLNSNDIEKIQIVKDNYYIDSIKLINYEEKASLLKEKKASFYIINFWASWCAPCIKEMKTLNALQQKAPYMRVITISQDRNIKVAEDFFKKNNYQYLEKYFDKDKKIFEAFPIRGLPTTFIANKNFKVLAKVEGIIEWDSKKFINWLNNF